MASSRLYIVGDAGSGKTTLLRYVAFRLADGFFKGESENDLLGGPSPIPVIIRIRELNAFLEAGGRRRGDLFVADSPKWLLSFLKEHFQEFNSKLDSDEIAHLLEEGSVLLLFDGLDEAHHDAARRRIIALIEGATRIFPRNRFVVTSRMLRGGGAPMPANFSVLTIAPLTTEASATFLEQWCRALFPENSQAAKRFYMDTSVRL